MLIPLGFFGGSSNGFEHIATAYGTGSSGTITFTGIPATFKHLQIRGIAQGTGTSSTDGTNLSLYVRYNSDATATQSYHVLYGNGASVLNGNAINQSYQFVGNFNGGYTTDYPANAYTASIIDILDYASTSKNKTSKFITGLPGTTAKNNVALGSTLLQSTSAVSSITISTGNATFFTSGTRFSIYGFKG